MTTFTTLDEMIATPEFAAAAAAFVAEAAAADAAAAARRARYAAAAAVTRPVTLRPATEEEINASLDAYLSRNSREG